MDVTDLFLSMERIWYSVKQMKDKNKKEVTCSRDEVIDMGYDPCKRCDP